MEIRKEFRYEMGHIVRNAWSQRCAKSAHGHSYRVEFLFEGNSPDNGQMLSDFGFIKKYLHPFVDSFDHAFWLWDRAEDQHLVKFFNENFERVIVSPFSTTAEMQAKMFYIYAETLIEYFIKNNKFENGEKDVRISGVRVHETTTGYAEYRKPENDKFPDTHLDKIVFSPGIKTEWPKNYVKFYDDLVKYYVAKHTPIPYTYLEICGRQTGKTARLITAAIAHAETGYTSIIYVRNASAADRISRLINCGNTRKNIHVVAFEYRDTYNSGKLYNNPRFFYDEFDFFRWDEEDIRFEDNVYLTTTPAYIRYLYNFAPYARKQDQLMVALKKANGNFWGQPAKPDGSMPSELGAAFVVNQELFPPIDITPLSNELKMYHIDPDAMI